MLLHVSCAQGLYLSFHLRILLGRAISAASGSLSAGGLLLVGGGVDVVGLLLHHGRVLPLHDLLCKR